MNEAERDMAL